MDVTLVVNNQKLNAHKNVLATNSDYFDRMFASHFKERFQDKIEITITDVNFEILSTLVQFFYTSEIYITENNVQVLLFCILLLYNIFSKFNSFIICISKLIFYYINIII